MAKAVVSEAGKWEEKPAASSKPTAKTDGFFVALFERLGIRLGKKGEPGSSAVQAVDQVVAANAAQLSDLRAEQRLIEAELSSEGGAAVLLALGGVAQITTKQRRLAEIKEAIALLEVAERQLHEANAIARHRDAGAQIAEVLPTYRSQLDTLAAKLSAAEEAYQAAAGTAEQLRGLHFDQDACAAQLSPGARGLVRRGLDSSCLGLAFEWRRAFGGDRQTPSQFGAWLAELSRWKSTSASTK